MEGFESDLTNIIDYLVSLYDKLETPGRHSLLDSIKDTNSSLNKVLGLQTPIQLTDKNTLLPDKDRAKLSKKIKDNLEFLAKHRPALVTRCVLLCKDFKYDSEKQLNFIPVKFIETNSQEALVEKLKSLVISPAGAGNETATTAEAKNDVFFGALLNGGVSPNETSFIRRRELVLSCCEERYWRHTVLKTGPKTFTTLLCLG